MEHLSEPDAALQEAFRVLRPGGNLLVTIPFAYPLHDQPHDYQRLTEHGLAHRLGRCGFARVDVREIGAGVETAALGLSLALSQAGVEALQARSLRTIFMPLALLLVPFVNILGWLLSRILPARRFFPAAYYLQATR